MDYYNYEQEAAKEHEGEILEAAEERRQAVLVRCCTAVGRAFRTVRAKLTRRGTPCDE